MKKRRCPRTNKQLEFLRRRKKECKAAHKALTKAGLTGTAEEQAISKEWFSLLRQHNKLRTALYKKKHQKEKMAAELKFRHNPNKFANNLFNHNRQAFLILQLM